MGGAEELGIDEKEGRADNVAVDDWGCGDRDEDMGLGGRRVLSPGRESARGGIRKAGGPFRGSCCRLNGDGLATR